ncbi:MAG: 5-(carboxyamino)imidazole ribonucleotide mutase [Pyrobaculum arsenaticum]|jgi:5-(carboxyamino)imidazole ribonucleotide mutase|uniref:N5-carboxyaminoimidazole ribonucleotide mutase n=1 Tax=Hydrogenobacter sp. TaxID=2152829 RepID=A0A7C2V2X0_9AQUI|nr:5-(carboxyamino)imidazole ribonucleotide mutase [Pyrobaculum arsenaticum]HCO38963.1 5-(carboxyamino)imidazole ribonucleotide mutase [Aquificaceae bacterium]
MERPLVGIIMGSLSDWEWLKPAYEVLKEFGVPCEVKVVSAHRTPELMYEYAKSARERGIEVIIAGAGGSAHLPGMTASMTTLPVIGVPVPSKHLSGVDSLYSIVQMPAGVPVATVGIGNGTNAGLLAVRILSIKYPELAKRLDEYQEKLREKVKEMNKKLEEEL